jgi:hypothetical protein
MSEKQIALAGGKSMPIKDFDLKSFCPNPSICMIAKRGSGKSWVCRALIKHFSYIPCGMIIAKTEKMSCFYGKFVPDLYIHYEYKSEILEKFLYRQESLIKKCIKAYDRGRKVDPRAFLVMDDCLASKGTWMNDGPILEVFFNGRHYQLLFILTMQFPLGIRPELRCNFDYIFLLAEDFYSNQKRLYDHYAGMFPSFEIFRQVFMQLTSDFGCMVIVNRGARGDLLDKIYHYKANNENIGMVGCKQFKEFHNNNYNPSWDDSNLKFNMNDYINKKSNKPNIVVAKVGKGKHDE